jgi:nucleotide-binding universal stress UspA family protein
MTDAHHPYTVVVGVDYCEHSDLVLDSAFDLASEKPAAVVHVLNVLPAPQSFLTPDIISTWDGKAVAMGESAQDLKQYVTRFLEKRTLAKRGNPARVVTHVLVDRPAYQLAQLASDVEADLVVVGTHGRSGVSRLVLGSVAEMTTRLAPCPVLVIRPKAIPAPIPSIEPPCPRCLETRRSSDGVEFWCEQHRERHGRRHTYYQTDRVSSDSNLPLVMQR